MSENEDLNKAREDLHKAGEGKSIAQERIEELEHENECLRSSMKVYYRALGKGRWGDDGWEPEREPDQDRPEPIPEPEENISDTRAPGYTEHRAPGYNFVNIYKRLEGLEQNPGIVSWRNTAKRMESLELWSNQHIDGHVGQNNRMDALGKNVRSVGDALIRHKNHENAHDLGLREKRLSELEEGLKGKWEWKAGDDVFKRLCLLEGFMKALRPLPELPEEIADQIKALSESLYNLEQGRMKRDLENIGLVKRVDALEKESRKLPQMPELSARVGRLEERTKFLSDRMRGLEKNPEAEKAKDENASRCGSLYTDSRDIEIQCSRQDGHVGNHQSPVFGMSWGEAESRCRAFLFAAADRNERCSLQAGHEGDHS